ncbi:MAG: hypothetical protein ACOYJS_07590 [Acutalibacteraceae bacterium]|jgi:DNA-directed RNA polymerase subunit M/transcription elongation factor TFIIS
MIGTFKSYIKAVVTVFLSLCIMLSATTMLTFAADNGITLDIIVVEPAPGERPSTIATCNGEYADASWYDKDDPSNQLDSGSQFVVNAFYIVKVYAECENPNNIFSVKINGREASYTVADAHGIIATYTFSTKTLNLNGDPNHVHTFIAVRAPSSKCGRPGVVTNKCTCGKIFFEKLPEKNHTPLVLKGKAPTCTEYGLTDGKKCSECNAVIEPQKKITPLGHNFVFSDGKKGTHIHKCATCGKTQPASNSDFTYVLLSSSDPDQSATYRVSCKVCGYNWKENRQSGDVPVAVVQTNAPAGEDKQQVVDNIRTDKFTLNLPENTSISLNAKQLDQTFIDSLKETAQIGSKEKIVKALDLTLIRTNSATGETKEIRNGFGALTVDIMVGSEHKGKKATLYSLFDDGSTELCEQNLVISSNGMLENVNLKHFSVYFVTLTEQPAAEEEAMDPVIWIMGALAAVLVIVIVIIIVILSKKKRA